MEKGREQRHLSQPDVHGTGMGMGVVMGARREMKMGMGVTSVPAERPLESSVPLPGMTPARGTPMEHTETQGTAPRAIVPPLLPGLLLCPKGRRVCWAGTGSLGVPAGTLCRVKGLSSPPEQTSALPQPQTKWSGPHGHFSHSSFPRRAEQEKFPERSAPPARPFSALFNPERILLCREHLPIDPLLFAAWGCPEPPGTLHLCMLKIHISQGKLEVSQ